MTGPRPTHPAPAAAVLPLLADTLRARVVEFCRLSRKHGLRVGLRETQDAGRIAALLLVADFTAFRDGLQALLCQGPDDVPVFRRLFQGYWCPADPTEMIRDFTEELVPVPQTGATHLITVGHADGVETAAEASSQSGASGLDVQRQVDFSQLPPAEGRALERLCGRLWQRMDTRRHRRLGGPQGKRALHLRRTWRRSLVYGGEPLRLAYRGRRPRKPRMVLLLDVSGSMELYTLLLLRFAYALQRRFRKSATFVFSTRLAEVTQALRQRRLETALQAVAGMRLGWQGGTRIGECLAGFVRGHGPRLLRQDTVFVVFSDGLDLSEPEQLAGALLDVRRRGCKVVWLNPLLALEGYEPIARGMAAALPLVDVFAAAHDLPSLLKLEQHLAT